MENSIAKPLKLIFEASLCDVQFPGEWKIGNIAPIHRKEDKNNLKQLQPQVLKLDLLIHLF